jgi:hypothetical protein
MKTQILNFKKTLRDRKSLARLGKYAFAAGYGLLVSCDTWAVAAFEKLEPSMFKSVNTGASKLIPYAIGAAGIGTAFLVGGDGKVRAAAGIGMVIGLSAAIEIIKTTTGAGAV